MKLQILIPMYKESFEVVKPLLDSIALQQNINFNEISIIIRCDGGQEITIPSEYYPFEIDYEVCPHQGVSATRNACLDAATADYVMFCDCDDMFYNMCGLWIIFREMEVGFDSLVSAFTEETRDPRTKEHIYINRDMDSTFVHGKIHRRKYLLEKDIRWNDNLTIHEDSYFNILCQKCSQNVKYCQTPFYLWKWRDESVCRHDPLYILKTYRNMLESNTALVNQFLKRGMKQEACFYATSMILDAWLTMNTKQWLDKNNKNYRNETEKRFKKYYTEFKGLYESIDEQAKNQITVGIRNRFYQEGLFFEEITFKDWIKHIEKLK